MFFRKPLDSGFEDPFQIFKALLIDEIQLRYYLYIQILKEPLVPLDPFDPRHCLSYRLRRAARTAARAYDRALRPLNLRNTQFTLLAALSIDGVQNIGEMADSLATDATTLTRNLDVLIRRGLVQEAAASGDARVRHVEISTAGQALYEQALPLWQDVQNRQLEELGKNGFSDLIGTLLQSEKGFGGGL